MKRHNENASIGAVYQNPVEPWVRGVTWRPPQRSAVQRNFDVRDLCLFCCLFKTAVEFSAISKVVEQRLNNCQQFGERVIQVF